MGTITSSRTGTDVRVDTALAVHLLGSFRVTRGGDGCAIPSSTWRLVGFLALNRRALDRSFVANCLWLDKTEERALANLRSCLWRLHRAGADLVEIGARHLRLAPGVSVDVDDLFSLGHALVDERRVFSPEQLDAVDTSAFAADLLPDWYDDFVELERERLRQVRLHAAEAFAARLAAAGRTTRALDVGLATVATDPLRESAHVVVIRTHLREGNVAEALRQYRRLCSVMEDQLGVAPSPIATELVRPWLAATASAVARPSR